MALKAVLESIDGLSSEIAGEYTKNDEGKFVLDVTPVDGLKLANVDQLTSALQKERQNNATSASKIKKLEADFKDLDPVKAREALQKLEELGDIDPDKKAAEALKIKEQQLLAKYEQQSKALTDKFTAERDALQKSLDTTESQLEETMIGQASIKAIADAKGSVELLQPIVARHSKLVKLDDGKRRVEIVDGQGVTRISPKANSTDPMTIEEFVAELKTKDAYSRAFDGSGASGGGASGGSLNGGGARGSFTISSADARNPSAYRAAKANAEKAGKSLQVVD